jgi:hypothetical protein
MSNQLTLQEQKELADLEREKAELMSRLSPPPDNSMFSEVSKRLALVTGQGLSEAAGGALGQKVGMAAAPWTLGLSVPIGGAIGGVAGYESYMKATGQEPTWGGRIMAGGLGAIPLGPEARLLAGAGRVTGEEIAKAAVKQAGYTVGLAGAAKSVDTGEMLTPTEAVMAAIGGGMGGAASRFAARTGGQDVEGKPLYVAGSKKAVQSAEEKIRNSYEDSLLETYRLLGGVSDPQAINPGFVPQAVEKLAGGRTALNEKLTAINQEVNTNLARRQLGLPSNAPLSFNVFSTLRSEANDAYKDVANISGGAKYFLDKLEEARADMKQSWRAWSADRSKNKISDPELLQEAKASTERVNKLEDSLEKIANQRGQPDLVDKLQEARKRLAQIHVVESALPSAAGGNIDALVIGEINRASPKMLTDNLKLIGDVANIPRQRDVMGEFVRPSAPSSLGTNVVLPGVLGTAGYQAFGTPGAIGGAVAGGLANAALKYPAQQAMLQFASKPGGFYQSGWNTLGGGAVPYYGTNAPSGLGLFLRNAPSAAMGTPNQPE